MTAQFARTPYRGRSGGSTAQEPHAALLIDFDNVTMGIRSDLTKELKNLLNSDIIKGKVAVQRAYADWRRYPQYIVPLAESSVDLIFAPAYGSAKKNATDIRLAIDALELVFTRSEIGTFILLSGDSDFSSLVLKLKEYGKYVIGVGIRESASDLLVQNCDEYYSYSALTGLTRAGDEAPAVSEDPWELVEMALRQMIENDDVMRSDRLKQVLLEMDPTFDEKSLGFQKFNKFLQEAASRGLLSLRKQDNGQFEVGPPSADGAEAAADLSEARETRRSRGRRGRGRRDEPRREEPRRDQLELPEDAGARVDEPQPKVAAAQPDRAPAAEEAAKPAAEATKPAPEVAQPKPEAAKPEPEAARAASRRGGRAKPEPAAAEAAAGGGDLNGSYSLLRRATSDLVRKNGPAVRDSDVKRRMLELEAGWDEANLGFSKFSRFLRQAHDAQVITLRKLENGNYDVLLSDGHEPEEERGGRRERGRGRDRTRRERTDRAPEPPSEAPRETVAAASPAGRDAEPAAGEKVGSRAAPARPTAAAEKPAAGQSTAAAATPAPAPAAALGFRRGSRGRGAPSGPPPLLEGQAARVSKPAGVAEPQSAVKSEPAAEPAAASSPRGRRSPAKKASSRGRADAFDAAALGLPRDAAEVSTYIARNYKGVGPKSVQALIERFGAGHVFEAFETKQDQVREVMGAARGDRLLEAWAADVAGRRSRSGGAVEDTAPPRKSARKSAAKGTRRGGRGRTPKK
jgi:uncharacterized protein (TIGR00288 family)